MLCWFSYGNPRLQRMFSLFACFSRNSRTATLKARLAILSLSQSALCIHNRLSSEFMQNVLKIRYNARKVALANFSTLARMLSRICQYLQLKTFIISASIVMLSTGILWK